MQAQNENYADLLNRFFCTEIYGRYANPKSGEEHEERFGFMLAVVLTSLEVNVQTSFSFPTKVIEHLVNFIDTIKNSAITWRAEDPTLLAPDNIVPYMMFVTMKTFYDLVEHVFPQNICAAVPQKYNATGKEVFDSLHKSLLLYICEHKLYMHNPAPEIIEQLLGNIIKHTIRTANEEIELPGITATAVTRMKINLPDNFNCYHKSLAILSSMQTMAAEAREGLLECTKPLWNKSNDHAFALLKAGIFDRKQFSAYIDLIIHSARKKISASQIKYEFTKLHNEVMKTSSLIKRRLNNLATLNAWVYDQPTLEIPQEPLNQEQDINIDLFYENLTNNIPLHRRMLATTSLKYPYQCTLFNRNIIDMDLVNNPGQPLVKSIQRFMNRELTRLAATMTSEEQAEVQEHIESLTAADNTYYSR